MRFGSAPGLEQRLDDVRVAFRRRPHERRLLLIGVGGVHVRARFEQQPHGVDAAGARRGHQRRLAVRMGDRGIGAGLQQRRDERRIARAAGLKQRRDAVMIRRVDWAPAAMSARAISRLEL